MKTDKPCIHAEKTYDSADRKWYCLCGRPQDEICPHLSQDRGNYGFYPGTHGQCLECAKILYRDPLARIRRIAETLDYEIEESGDYYRIVAVGYDSELLTLESVENAFEDSDDESLPPEKRAEYRVSRLAPESLWRFEHTPKWVDL